MVHQDIIEHIGIKRRSGRYPWGSGDNVQRSIGLLAEIKEMKNKGMSEKEIAEAHGLTIAKLRSAVTIANQEQKEWLMEGAKYLKKEGMNDKDIAKELGVSESSVRNYVNFKESNTTKQINNLTQTLKDEVADKEYLDIGAGVERQLGVSKTKLKAAVAALKEEGYVEHDIYVRQLTDRSKYTIVRVLTKETDLEVVKQNSSKISSPEKWTDDGGITFQGLKPVKNMDWGRVDIRYAEDGGADKDGVIELRRNVKDLDMGHANYAQVRIAVAGTHYMKGMAMYGDNLPPGKDAVFYTNKTKDVSKEKVLKELKSNKDNPFGATIKRQNGLLNIVNEEGDWNNWKSTLSAQFLSKQDVGLVRERIGVTFKSIVDEYNDIKSITNSVVREHLLATFDDGLSSKARHLKLAGIPGTKGHVILPFNEVKVNEVYAPNYPNGSRVVLVRYPHGGIFELPELVVNNKNKAAKSVLGTAIDAIGINPSVAGKLSGADFDGDTVYVIPNDSQKIRTSRSLDGLKNFEPTMYKRDYDTISSRTKQIEMGKVSNLITDMTIKGAEQQEIARAVRHSMVVIDAEKHKLDYKQSAIDNGIDVLKKKYQTHEKNGKTSVSASTIISKSKQTVEVEYTTPTGEIKKKKEYLMDITSDAHTLSSGTRVEKAYANYVNDLKKLQTQVKKDRASIVTPSRLPSATVKYADQVASLDEKLNKAMLNAPRERKAQIIATSTYYKNLDYDMDKDQKKKLRTQSLTAAREKTGAKKELVKITPIEWEAIENGAISPTKLKQILNNSDIDEVRKLATPRESKEVHKNTKTKVNMLINKGYTIAEAAQATGLPVSMIKQLVLDDQK